MIGLQANFLFGFFHQKLPDNIAVENGIDFISFNGASRGEHINACSSVGCCSDKRLKYRGTWWSTSPCPANGEWQSDPVKILGRNAGPGCLILSLPSSMINMFFEASSSTSWPTTKARMLCVSPKGNSMPHRYKNKVALSFRKIAIQKHSSMILITSTAFCLFGERLG